jgi:hypothetical protein
MRDRPCVAFCAENLAGPVGSSPPTFGSATRTQKFQSPEPPFQCSARSKQALRGPRRLVERP